MSDNSYSGGTGQKLADGTIVVAGACSLIATIISIVSIWLQTKNYRKPLLQRYVIRILLMVPIYSISSWISLISIKAALYTDPIRDLYEAFTIYTFFQLLINFIGGERALIIMMHGREPVHHLWPMNHFLEKVDISDPHTFLAIKRGILQYAWLKPVFGLATVIMKATGVYKEGYIGVSSGYFWQGIAYNISVSLSLYALGMFWVCMNKDLQPFRPVPKFLCIKLIIFASYWQGFGLSILVWLGAIPDDVPGYTPDNLAAAIQDALICMEMPAFAFGHWYAFSWRDYADITISAARMPVKYAIRDAFGIRDLIEDTKETFSGTTYEYRLFDSGDNIMAHEESSSRAARMLEGMRYERGGKGKYWLPAPGGANDRTPLLRAGSHNSANASGSKGALGPKSDNGMGTTSDGANDSVDLDPEEEALYERAKKLEFGDWNYPVITAHTARRGAWMADEQPDILTTSANRNLLQPTTKYQQVRKKHVKDVVKKVKSAKEKGKGKENDAKSSASSSGEASRSVDKKGKGAPLLNPILHRNQSDGASSTHSGKSDRSQLVDLVVEDTKAEEVEAVRARKEGSAGWNAVQPRRFVRTYGKEGEEIREGFEPTDEPPVIDPKEGEDPRSPESRKPDTYDKGLGGPNEDKFVIEEDNGATSPGAEESKAWGQKDDEDEVPKLKPKYGLPGEEGFENVWGGASEHKHGEPKENP